MSTAPAAMKTAGDTMPHPGQWRLAEVQIANWGTLDGAIYRIPVARKGHLVTGPSGSGKSSILDAIAAVLTPDKWLRLNAAAQGAGPRSDQRSIPSYVRGAWSRTTDVDEDRVVSAYLRHGATWSGIVLRFENGIDRPVSLARLFFLKGSATGSADVADLCLLDRSALELRDLEPYAGSGTGLETRKVQAAWPDAVVTSNHRHDRFYARMRSLFGIANEGALQLLHKTQAAKSLDSLDQLFRDYMLERPATFALAETAVAQFGELRDAHERVVELRLQRDHLLRLRTTSETFDAANDAAHLVKILSSAVVPYQKHRTLGLARDEREALSATLGELREKLERAVAAQRQADDDYDRAQRLAHDQGGGEAEHLERHLRTATELSRATADRRATLGRQLALAGIARVPTSAGDLAELVATIDRTLGQPSGSARVPHDVLAEHAHAKDAAARVASDVQRIRTSGTTVPGSLLDVRQAVVDATGLPLHALPFAAEMIEIRSEHAVWTGAIERVLRRFALTMLVRTEHLAQVRAWVDSHRIEAQLVFEEVTSAELPHRARSARSLVNRVHVTPGPFADWVVGQLSTRFDYTCVDSPEELGQHDRAVTLNGQLKTSRTRYEKDDRRRIDDRAQWVLGDRVAKLEALVAQQSVADERLAAATEALEKASATAESAQRRFGALTTIREQAWQDVDTDSADRVVREIEERLELLTREDSSLRAALEAVTAARTERDDAALHLSEVRAARHHAVQTDEVLGRVVSSLEAEISRGDLRPLDDDVMSTLEGLFRKIQRSVTRQNVIEIGQEVMARLQRERDRELETARRAGNELSSLATEFSHEWPTAAADLSPSVEDRHGFLEILDGIITHNLPEHEARFLRLLRERSRDMIGELVSDILGAPHEIQEGVLPVNTSLRRAPFDSERYLRLRVKMRRSETVVRFLDDLRSISEGGWGDDDAESAERRFATLAEVMRKFASSEHADRVWRNQCLDTRLHVAFLADEIDEHGQVHATYDSGAAMSGGQQQKLVIFCLAAALRYQLADADDAVPRYGTVILDEAFDKADSRYTRMALDIFVEFGFHMVLATPQKLLQTIEPYVGAATSVENPTRRRSEVADVPWREHGHTRRRDQGGERP